MTDLGRYLSEIRNKRHLSLRDLAKQSELCDVPISHSTLWAIEKGKNSRGNVPHPNPNQLKTISTIYHVDYEKLMNLAGYTPSVDKLTVEPTSDGATISATTKWETSHEPLDVYGEITAGLPTFADEHIIGQTIIPDDLIDKYGRDNLFALQVDGDSMSKVIAPGFIAVFVKDCEVENGDICAVLVDGENATLKKFKETSKAVILEPESFNPIYKPLIFPKNIDQDFRILGKYVFATSLLQ